ncbi:hypothetical protein [Nocardia asteroides]|uniref:hypothetical protein n=1 Tax=Nocardia asteroides TaxID=1824 RepID=UPI0033D3E04C
MTDPHAETIASLVADTSPYLSCDECFARLDEYVESVCADPRYDDLAMRTHLAGCGACAEEARALRELIELPG